MQNNLQSDTYYDKQWEGFITFLEKQNEAEIKANIEEIQRTQKLSNMVEYTLESRVVPPLPPQPPSQIDYIDDFKRVGEGDVEIWMRGRKAPMEYYPDGDAVKACTIAKKAIPMFLEALYIHTKTSLWIKLKIIWILLRIKLQSNYKIRLPYYVEPSINYAYYLIENYLLKPERYSRQVREIYRVLTLYIEQNDGIISSNLLKKLRDITCFTLEYDSAYRRRFMDILSEMDVKMLRENPGKEINRMFQLWISRELFIEQKEKFTKVHYLVTFFFKYYDHYMKGLIYAFSNINIEELKMSKNERYWARQHTDYDFFGKTMEERKKDNVLEFNSES